MGEFNSMFNSLASSYYKLLTTIDWDDKIQILGLQEGLNKFLSNAYLGLMKDKYGLKKYLCSDYISTSAQLKIDNGLSSDLVFEHMVPKKKYIQLPCENLAKKGRLTIDFIEDLLIRYWWLATITKEENLRLNRNTMPIDWDQKNIFARYDEINLQLKPFNTSIRSK